MLVDGIFKEFQHGIHDDRVGMNVAAYQRHRLVRMTMLDVIGEIWMVTTMENERFLQTTQWDELIFAQPTRISLQRQKRQNNVNYVKH